MPAQRPTKEEKRVNPPRPPNPWILYRQDKWKEFKRTDCKYSQSEISRFIAAAWAKEQPHVKAEYERRAAQAKAEHHIRYPHYVYKPQQKRKDKKDDSAAGSQPKAKRVSSTGSTAIEPIPIANPLYPVDPCEMMMVAAKYGEMGPSPPMSLACSPDTIFGPSGSSSQAAASQATLAAAIAQQLARISSLPVEPADAPVVSEQTLTPATPVTASLWNVSDYHDPQQTIEQDLGWMTALTGEGSVSMSLQGEWLDGLGEDFTTESLFADPHVFQFTQSDDLLSGELDVKLANFEYEDNTGWMNFSSINQSTPGPSWISDNFNHGLLPQDLMHQQSYMDSPYSPYSTYSQSEGGEGQFVFPDMEGMQQYLTQMDDIGSNHGSSRVASSSSSSSRITTPVEPKAELLAPYQPPPGAMQSMTRRVGGSWKPNPRPDSGSLQQLHASAG